LAGRNHTLLGMEKRGGGGMLEESDPRNDANRILKGALGRGKTEKKEGKKGNPKGGSHSLYVRPKERTGGK